MVEFSTRIYLINYLPGMHCLHVPAMAIKKLKGDSKKRLLCTVNDLVEFSCGILPMKDGKGLIMFSKVRMQTLNVERGDLVKVSLCRDESKYGMDLPEELAEVLLQDPEGDNRFHGLTPGKQRNIILWVASVKNPQLRIDRALKLIDNLKSLPPGKETARKIFGL